LTGSYLVTRIEPEEPKKPPEEKKVAQAAAPAASKEGQKEKVNSATKGREGKAGGEGKEPRARDPNAKEDEKPAPPPGALMTDKNRHVLDNVVATMPDLGNFTGLPGPRQRGGIGSGTGKGTGFGPGEGTGTTRGSHGTGPGGGGSVEGDFQSQGKIDVGE